MIDFGSSGLGNPAVDIATVIHTYGESFLSRFENVYPELSSYLKRARFYAETFELQWALSGINSKDITWFLGHLGSAKDINYRAQIHLWKSVMTFEHIYELLKVLGFSIDIYNACFTLKLELLQYTSDSNCFRAHIWHSGFYQIQSTFP